MFYRDLNHFAGSYRSKAGARYRITISTIVNPKTTSTWVAIGLQNDDCPGKADGRIAIKQVVMIVRVPILSDDFSDPAFLPRLVEGATASPGAPGWNWAQDQTADLTGFQLNLYAPENGPVIGCDLPPGLTGWYRTCCGGWVVFEFETRGVWNVRDIAYATVVLGTPGADVSCDFIGDGTHLPGTALPAGVCRDAE